jgi:hypothetical protein
MHWKGGEAQERRILAAMPPCRALLLLLPVSRWRAFFATFGVAVPKSVRDVDALVLFLATAKLTPGAGRALSAVAALAKRDGKRDLVVCARAHAYDLGADGETAAELAVRVVVASKTNELARLVVKRAPLHVERRAPVHPTRDYVAAKALGAKKTSDVSSSCRAPEGSCSTSCARGRSKGGSHTTRGASSPCRIGR